MEPEETQTPGRSSPPERRPWQLTRNGAVVLGILALVGTLAVPLLRQATFHNSIARVEAEISELPEVVAVEQESKRNFRFRRARYAVRDTRPYGNIDMHVTYSRNATPSELATILSHTRSAISERRFHGYRVLLTYTQEDTGVFAWDGWSTKLMEKSLTEAENDELSAFLLQLPERSAVDLSPLAGPRNPYVALPGKPPSYSLEYIRDNRLIAVEGYVGAEDHAGFLHNVTTLPLPQIEELVIFAEFRGPGGSTITAALNTVELDEGRQVDFGDLLAGVGQVLAQVDEPLTFAYEAGIDTEELGQPPQAHVNLTVEFPADSTLCADGGAGVPGLSRDLESAIEPHLDQYTVLVEGCHKG